MLRERRELFDAYIIQAPALWWNGEEMTDRAKGFFASHPDMDKALYLGIGGGDGFGMRQELRRFVEVIEQNRLAKLHWIHEVVGDEGHMDARLLLNYYGLKFVFSDLTNLQDLSDDYSDEKFLASERRLLEKWGNSTRRPVEDYLGLYSMLASAENDSSAITVLKRASEAYPGYPMLLNNLAQLYEKTEQTDLAIEAYESGIEISRRSKLGLEDGYQKEIERLRSE